MGCMGHLRDASETEAGMQSTHYDDHGLPFGPEYPGAQTQLVRAEEPCALLELAGHARHSVKDTLPITGLYVWLGQSLHWVSLPTPVSFWYLPLPHDTQVAIDTAAIVSEYVPRPHRVHVCESTCE